MKGLKDNLAEIIFLAGLFLLNAPAYMINLKVGLLVSGISCFAVALGMVKGGD